MEKMLGNDYRAFLESYDKEEYKALRFNPLKGDKECFLKESLFSLEPVLWEENGYYINEEKPGKSALHDLGLFYVQEPSAMSAVAFLDIDKGDKVLLCHIVMHGNKILVLHRFNAYHVVIVSIISLKGRQSNATTAYQGITHGLYNIVTHRANVEF